MLFYIYPIVPNAPAILRSSLYIHTVVLLGGQEAAIGAGVAVAIIIILVAIGFTVFYKW